MKFLYTFFCLVFSPIIFAAEGAEESKGGDGDFENFFDAPLVQHPNSSLSTPDVQESAIYSNTGTLNLVFIHPYESIFAPCIGLKLPGPQAVPEALMSRIVRRALPPEAAATAVDDGGAVGGAGIPAVPPIAAAIPDAEFFLLIHRPIATGPMLMRSHYWASKDLPAAAVRNVHINMKVQVMNHLGVQLVNVTGDAYAHGAPQVVCSPSNMPIALDMREESSHLLYSLAEKVADGKQALTCHWIPTEGQWERIYETEFSMRQPSPEEEVAILEGLIPPLPTASISTRMLFEKFSFLFGEDPFWNIVKRNFFRS